MGKSWLDISGENDDFSASVYTFFDGDRYLFDCGEGFQRVIKERSSVKISKIKSIFISNLSWDSIGGLMGIFYIMAGIDSCKDINVYGPKGLYNVFYYSRQFFNVTLNINVHEMNDTTCQLIKGFDMDVTTIPITIKKKKEESLVSSEPFEKRCYFNYVDPAIWTAMIERNASADEIYAHVEKTSNDTNIDRDAIICYIGSTRSTPGRFYPERAVALGIPRGPFFQKLTSGQTVVSPKSGEEVHSHQVMDPPVPGSNFLYIRCPSIEYFDSLFEKNVFLEYQLKGTKVLSTIIHVTPADVMQHTKYQEFMALFGDKTKHVVVNKENCTLSRSYVEAEMDITKFSSFLPSLFPTPFVANTPSPVPAINGVSNENVMACELVVRSPLSPPSLVGKLEKVAMEHEVSEDNEDRLFDLLKTNVKALQLKDASLEATKLIEDTKDEEKNVYPRLMFTGTGAAKPTKKRGVTGHLIETQKDQFMIMDAGEGTLAQIDRHYGRDQLKHILFNLKLIWISHMHADHHLGVPSILERREKLEKKYNVVLPKIVVVSPPEFCDWIQSLNTVLPIDHLSFAYDQENDSIDQCYRDLGIQSLDNIKVDHCPDARGVVIKFNSGFKLSFSGDTRPCEAFIEAGKDSDLMIHEATFEDHLVEDSVEKKHSTMGEALTVGKDMNAKYTILTHFSGKTNHPIVTSKPTTNFGTAFDFLQVSPYQYPLLKHLNQLVDLEVELLSNI